MMRFILRRLVSKLIFRLVMVVLAMGTAALTLPGCSTTTGTKVEAADVAFITKGKTTKSELLTKFGQPARRAVESSGGEVLLWFFAKTDIDAKTFIPFVGAFMAGSTTAFQELQVKFDKNGIVTDHKYSDGVATSR